MTAKEYLKEVKRKDDQISRKQEDYESLRSTLMSKGIDYTSTKVNGGGDSDRMSNILGRLQEMEDDINQMIDDFIDFKLVIQSQINALPIASHVALLKYVYVEYGKLHEFAQKYNYDYAYIVNMHGKALVKFSRMHRESIKTYEKSYI